MKELHPGDLAVLLPIDWRDCVLHNVPESVKNLVPNHTGEVVRIVAFYQAARQELGAGFYMLIQNCAEVALADNQERFLVDRERLMPLGDDWQTDELEDHNAPGSWDECPWNPLEMV